MSLDTLPVELLDKVLYHTSLQDRMSMRLVCREIERKISLTRYHHFKRATTKISAQTFPDVSMEDFLNGNLPALNFADLYKPSAVPAPSSCYVYDDIELTCAHKNPKRFSISFGKRVRYVNVHSSKREEIASIRWRLFNSFRVDRVMLKCVNFNTIPVSFVEDFLINCAFRSMVIVVTEQGFHRSVLSLIHKYSSLIEELLVCTPLLPQLVYLPPVRLIAAPVLVDESPSNEVFLNLVESGHKKLLLAEALVNEHTLLHAFLTISDSPTYREVEFDLGWKAIDSFMRMIGCELTWYRGSRVGPCSNPDFEVRNGRFDEFRKPGVKVKFSVKHRNAVIAFEVSTDSSNHFPMQTRAHIVSVLEESTWDEVNAN